MTYRPGTSANDGWHFHHDSQCVGVNHAWHIFGNRTFDHQRRHLLHALITAQTRTNNESSDRGKPLSDL